MLYFIQKILKFIHFFTHRYIHMLMFLMFMVFVFCLLSYVRRTRKLRMISEISRNNQLMTSSEMMTVEPTKKMKLDGKQYVALDF